MPPINLLIKPASSSCNLRCGYCFYHDEAAKRITKSYGMMSRETIEAIVKKALLHATVSCTFGFQGGEPTLSGLDFFKTVVNLQNKHNVKNITVNNALQTNGTLIDDEWAAFFAKNKFLVGISLDGHQSLHDFYRKDISGNGTFARVMQSIETLKRHNVDFNVLTVVTAQTAKNIKEVYLFLMKNGLTYQQYIPCLDPMDEKNGGHRYSLTPQLYVRFLKNLFDLWYKDRASGKFIYNRYFENLAALLQGQRPESCDMNGMCSIQYAFEADGGCYPCDFYMLDNYYIGNINTDSMETIDQNCRRIGFIEQSAYLPEQCQSCRWIRLCHGGCRRNRVADASGPGLNYFCEAYQEFFKYAIPRLAGLAGVATMA
ncbi:MAG: anaerobic sulfatase maturase [Eubacteriales bacterium]|nr:anaerobic sulfatase maturase [Eubacteriales bacterium]